MIRESSADFGKLRLIYITFAHASRTGTDPVLAGIMSKIKKAKNSRAEWISETEKCREHM